MQLTKAAVYYHFPAKELLLLELTRPFLDALSRMVTDLRTGEQSDPARVLAAYLDLFVEHIDMVGLLGREPATLYHPDIGQRVRSLVNAIQQALAGPDPSPSRSVRTACAMGVIHAVPQMPVRALRSQRGTVLAAALAALGESTAERAAAT